MNKPDTIPFYKMSGTGNDFIIFNCLDQKTAKSFGEQRIERPKAVQMLCKRSTSIGADGVVFLDKNEQGVLAWDFYNSDGSKAEMCGNAARCVVWLSLKLGLFDKEVRIKTLAGEVLGELTQSNRVKVVMPVKVQSVNKKQVKLKDGSTIEGHFVNTGVPHFVVVTSRPFSTMKGVAHELRRHEDFGSSGTNVTFIDRVSNKIKSISFERGVEDFTLSCGTGAVAAGICAAQGEKLNAIEVSVPGGELVVSIDKKTNRPTLEGEVELIFSGELDKKHLEKIK